VMLGPDLLRGSISYAHTGDDVELLISTVTDYVKRDGRNESGSFATGQER